MTAKVAIIHPWLPQYRVPFFRALKAVAATRGIAVHVFHGEVPPEWRARGDSNVVPEVAQLVRTRWIGFGGRKLALRDLRPVRAGGPYDLIVVEQAVRNVESYRLLIGTTSRRVAMWGHGRTYTKRTGRLQERVKRWLTLRSRWFFSYTRGGADDVLRAGFPPERVTVVQNTIDSSPLRDAVTQERERPDITFREEHGLGSATAVFIGGLDASKRLDFIIAAGDAIAAAIPSFRLLVVGSGELEGWLRGQAQTRPWLVPLGHATGLLKAKALAASRAMLMPGRVGLVAVDSFAAGVPLVTVDYPFHAPEFEYLDHGKNSLVVANDIAQYSEAVIRILTDDSLGRALVTGCNASFERFTLDAMVENFLSGIEGALQSFAHPR
ncbi:glycosyltransferase family 4 protein [Curtobacterium sp. MCBA15_012]|uniref:glycosyltransferase family 4 protein n=1 Tax=Curtobacterium sp. MCBA15_012 TaxID=1898738 RepID=UPI000AD3E3A0|nr:glycosyltransferase family 4 protein [Curtobacterium sp. MCBA15_012]WIB00728.1 glycosyltransferase family 4 protein [Curtobacterium sp. MCBA15_012]